MRGSRAWGFLHELRRATTSKMAAQILQELTPAIATGFSDHVQPLLDHFLAKGFINDEVYQTILESSCPSKDKARNLLSAIKDVIQADENCFYTMLSVFQEVFGNKNKLVLLLFEKYNKYTRESQPPPSKRPRLHRASSEPAIRQSVNAEHHPAPASTWRYPACPEVKVIQQSTPKLVKTLSGFVANVSDECLSEGLITESVNKMLLESISSSEDKVRKLLQAVRSSISVDRRCYKIFVSILNTTVPPAIRDKLVSEINIKYKELLKSGTDPEYPKVDSAREHLLQEVELAISSEFKIVVDEFKEAVEKHIRTCIEKERLE